MKILVIGGSYFLGRWFVQHAYKRHDITVLNRGTIPIGLEGVEEIVADRHNEDELCKLEAKGEGYDAVLDFCAYNAGDISLILKHLCFQPPKRYIYISTVDVYKKGTGGVLDESAELTDAGDVSEDEAEYIRGKTDLEHELVSECDKYGIKGVSIRPAILYGPGNYAPRENVYFEWISRAGQIIHPADADGYFQMLYVSDAALGLLKLCETEEEKLKSAYNFCTEEILTYAGFEEALGNAYRIYKGITEGEPFERVDVSTDTVLKQGIPLPFPLGRKDSQIYSGARFGNLDVNITSLEQGLLSCMKVMI